MCRRRSPVGPDWAAKERGAEAGEEEVSGEGPMGVAAGEVVEHVKRASYVVWAATKEWRRKEEVRVAAAAGRATGTPEARGWGEGDEVGSDVEEESDGDGEEERERRQRRQQEEEDVESDDEMEVRGEVGGREEAGGAEGGARTRANEDLAVSVGGPLALGWEADHVAKEWQSDGRQSDGR